MLKPHSELTNWANDFHKSVYPQPFHVHNISDLFCIFKFQMHYFLTPRETEQPAKKSPKRLLLRRAFRRVDNSPLFKKLSINNVDKFK